VAYCPVCKSEWPPETAECPICGKELTETAERSEWVIIGEVEDKLTVDFAKETLAAYDIPAVIVSRSGFFGQVGLTLTGFYSGRKALFEVSVPIEYAEEASEVLYMTLGEKWHRKEA
jgi:hypothetical protein